MRRTLSSEIQRLCYDEREKRAQKERILNNRSFRGVLPYRTNCIEIWINPGGQRTKLFVSVTT